MDLRQLTLSARDHLESLGCTVEVAFGPDIRDEASLRESAAALPVSVQHVYRQIGDGFSFRWKSPRFAQRPVGDECSHAEISFPAWRTLVERASESANGWFRNESFKAYSVADPALARASAARMANWAWFHEEPNGDRLCVDFATGEVVYDEHDWFDAGTGANGHVMASDITNFLAHWAHACFATPTGRYWPDTFLETGLDWSSKFFPHQSVG